MLVTAADKGWSYLADNLRGKTEGEPLNILDFCKQELTIDLYPRQRIIMKIFYQLPLTDEEQADWDMMLAGGNIYARSWVTDPPYNFLLLVGGRRGSKTTVAAAIQAYEMYKLLHIQNPQGDYGILPTQRISFINCAAAQEQAGIFFNAWKGLVTESEYLQGQLIKDRDTRVDFAKNLRAECLHSNSRSQRGRTAWMVTFDELAHFIDTAGPNSDEQVWKALQPSTKTFLEDGKTLVVTSPGAAEGLTFDKYQQIAEGKIPHALCVQLATWEMNPYLTLEDLADEQLGDPEFFAMEYGAQFGEKQGKFFSFLAVEKCFDSTNRVLELEEIIAQRQGYNEEELNEVRQRTYHAHCDPGLRSNRLAFVLVHADYESGDCWLDYAFTMEASAEGEVDLEIAQKYIEEVFALFKFRRVTFDQWNSALMIKQLKGKGIPAEELTFTEKSNMEIFSNLKQLVSREKLHIPSLPLLQAEMNALVRTITRHGFSVAAPDRGPVRTDDVADALAAAAFKATEHTGSRRRTFLKI